MPGEPPSTRVSSANRAFTKPRRPTRQSAHGNDADIGVVRAGEAFLTHIGSAEHILLATAR
jgi:hypothetical protein